MISSDGSLAEPRPAEFEAFYRTLTVGDERGVSAITDASLHFPAVHYFALFIAKCLLAREKVGALSLPNLVVLRGALEGDNTYSLGAIVARRLHLNNLRVKSMAGFMLLALQPTLMLGMPSRLPSNQGLSRTCSHGTPSFYCTRLS